MHTDTSYDKRVKNVDMFVYEQLYNYAHPIPWLGPHEGSSSARSEIFGRFIDYITTAASGPASSRWFAFTVGIEVVQYRTPLIYYYVCIYRPSAMLSVHKQISFTGR